MADDARWWQRSWVGRVAVALFALVAMVWFGADAPAGLALDDSYIHLDHARNLVRHGELRITRSVASHAVTSPLWTLLLAGAYALTRDVVQAASLLSLLVLPALALAAHRLASAARLRWWAALAAALLTVLTGPLLWLAASGMESALFAAAAMWVIAAIVQRRSWEVGAAVAIALLIRIEGVALAGPWALLLLRDRDRRMLPGLLVPAAAMAALVTWTLVEIGRPLPSTLDAKRFSHGAGELSLLADAKILAEAWAAYARHGLANVSPLPGAGALLLATCAAGAAWLARLRSEAALWLLVIVAGLFVAYVLLLPVQGAAGRYQVVTWVAPGLLAAAGIGGVAHLGRGRRTRIAARATAGALALLLTVSFAGSAAAWRTAFNGHVQQILDAHGRAGAALARANRACLPVLAYDIGAIAFHVDQEDCSSGLIDLGGLVDPSLLPILRSPRAIQRLALTQGGPVYLALPTHLDGRILAPPLGLRTVGPPGRRRLVDPTGLLRLDPVAGMPAARENPYRWLVAANAPRVAVWRAAPTEAGAALMEQGDEALARLSEGERQARGW